MNKYFKANAILSIFSKRYMELKKDLPIRPSEMGVLNIISETEGPHTPVVLAEMLGVSKPMITAHITSLEENGYITKTPSSQDKRVYHIIPTEKALDLVEVVRVDMNKILEKIEKNMGQEDFEKFIKLTEIANGILESKGE